MEETPIITPKAFAEAGGVTNGFASLVLRGEKPMPKRVAIRVWRKTGLKLGPIAQATDEEIAVLEKFEELGAAPAEGERGAAA